MTEQKMMQALGKIVDKNFFYQLKDHVIIQDDNHYALFGQYIITDYKDHCELRKDSRDNSYIFSHIKYAVTWATLDKINKIQECNRILFLDQCLLGIDVNIKIHSNIFKKTNNVDTKLLFHSKYTEETLKKKRILRELEQFISQAKSYQLNKFIVSSYK
jgi:hypothetical protein